MSAKHTENRFEEAVENTLLTKSGYEKLSTSRFNRELALFDKEVIAFIKHTQPENWDKLKNYYGDKAEQTLIGTLCRDMNSENGGCLTVLRKGFRCAGMDFKVMYFAPASGMNPDVMKLYKSNKLFVTRQLKYKLDRELALDLVLSINGIPFATVELKNAMTSQTVEDAISQYKRDRSPGDLIFSFKKRTLVHFAVDTEKVFMTTRLNGDKTYFLPFNKGYDDGADNPPVDEGYKTDYLWEEVLEYGSIIDILKRFIHLQKGDKKGKDIMIFPRYHQLDCVRKLVESSAIHGAGKDYLIQHSAGSGKSNSIAWLAHRLSTLYNDKDEKIFKSVVVITDRVVLDKQLQDTISQFDHVGGVVVKINKNSKQLGEALKSGAQIIITTLQKFPFVDKSIKALGQNNYAVIVDEAHSSQSGETAAEMKGVLSLTAEEKEALTTEDKVNEAMKKRGKQKNLSFYAFTATPKQKTIMIFGNKDHTGLPVAFHVYSMKQAIEEHFIMDVLKHYTTYNTYYKLVKTIEDDPEIDKKKGTRALARFVSIHPTNIAQKTEIIIEHFMRFVRGKIGGKAKAMLVTSSRLHAVKYKLAFDKYISDKKYDVKTLVAFSGEVEDPEFPDKKYTEIGMNAGIKEKELPEKFDTDEFRVLIVADKYQTGFDQPLLHTMYVDKKLSGVQAVQTLSRLNRTHIEKDDTYILDFMNEPEDIQEAFTPYYKEAKIEKETNPDKLNEYRLKFYNTYRIFSEADVDAFASVMFSPKNKLTKSDHSRLNKITEVVIERFFAVPDDEDDTKSKFKTDLARYKNLYSFMSQIVEFPDSELEKLYVFVRLLLNRMPKGGGGVIPPVDVELERIRIEISTDGEIELEGGTIPPTGETGGGTPKEQDLVELSKLVDDFNEKFGAEFAVSDFQMLENKAFDDEELREQGRVNTKENVGLSLKRKMKNKLISWQEKSDKSMDVVYENKDAYNDLCDFLLERLYPRFQALNTHP